MKIKICNNFQSIILNRDQFITRIHFIGIGGAGMSGIARILINLGYKVTGSDLKLNKTAVYLMRMGVKIFFTHHAKNIYGADVIVISSAIKCDNPEVIAARQLNILMVHRAEILEMLMDSRFGIAVAGTHGKSTTTAMIVSIYFASGLNPTFVNGEVIKSLNISSHLGDSEYFIMEADESDASFLFLHPVFAVITNIEADHMDTYRGDVENLKHTFLNFLNNLPCTGKAIVCIDDIVIRTLLPQIKRKIVTYGFSKDADVRVVDYYQRMDKNSFVLYRKDMSNLYLMLNLPGRHNALNAAAAIAVSIECGISDDSILRAMCQFSGVNRRFENFGIYNLKKFNGKSGEIILVSDYGHHPVELSCTIETIRAGWPNKRLVMVFQPHRFTRTRDLYENFVEVLSLVDVLLMLNIYSSGEGSIPGINSFSLCATIRKYGKINPILVSEDILLCVLSSILQDNDFLLLQGAGSIGYMAGMVLNKLICSDS